jgi:two-component system, cell cycle sensor histidine kinase and response regulator CckA
LPSWKRTGNKKTGRLFLWKSAAEPRGEETILLVEDEESLCSVTQEFLTNKGYQIIVAEDFQKAVEAAENYTRHIDLLMTDVVSPGASGPQLADRLSTSRPDIKVLFVSGLYGRRARPR